MENQGFIFNAKCEAVGTFEKENDLVVFFIYDWGKMTMTTDMFWDLLENLDFMITNLKMCTVADALDFYAQVENIA